MSFTVTDTNASFLHRKERIDLPQRATEDMMGAQTQEHQQFHYFSPC